MYMANLGASQGWSHSYTDADSVTNTTGESISSSVANSVSESVSHTVGESIGKSLGTSTTETNGTSQGFSRGHSFAETLGQNQSHSNPKRVSASVHQVIISRIEEHSKKPQEARERIVKLMGDVPKIELFARQKVDGWDVWGNEVDCDVELNVVGV